MGRLDSPGDNFRIHLFSHVRGRGGRGVVFADDPDSGDESTSRDQQAPAGGCPLDGHRDAGGFEQAARQFVVARNRFGQCTGAIGLSRSNPAKVHPLTELEKAVIIQAANRNLPLAGRAEDRVLGGRDREPVGELREFWICPATSNGRS